MEVERGKAIGEPCGGEDQCRPAIDDWDQAIYGNAADGSGAVELEGIAVTAFLQQVDAVGKGGDGLGYGGCG